MDAESILRKGHAETSAEQDYLYEKLGLFIRIYDNQDSLHTEQSMAQAVAQEKFENWWWNPSSPGVWLNKKGKPIENLEWWAKRLIRNALASYYRSPDQKNVISLEQIKIDEETCLTEFDTQLDKNVYRVWQQDEAERKYHDSPEYAEIEKQHNARLQQMTELYKEMKPLVEGLPDITKKRMITYLSGESKANIARQEGVKRQAVDISIERLFQKWGWTKEKIKDARLAWQYGTLFKIQA